MSEINSYLPQNHDGYHWGNLGDPNESLIPPLSARLEAVRVEIAGLTPTQREAAIIHDLVGDAFSEMVMASQIFLGFTEDMPIRDQFTPHEYAITMANYGERVTTFLHTNIATLESLPISPESKASIKSSREVFAMSSASALFLLHPTEEGYESLHKKTINVRDIGFVTRCDISRLPQRELFVTYVNGIPLLNAAKNSMKHGNQNGYMEHTLRNELVVRNTTNDPAPEKTDSSFGTPRAQGGTKGSGRDLSKLYFQVQGRRDTFRQEKRLYEDLYDVSVTVPLAV